MSDTVKCNMGHVSNIKMWDCPVCVNKMRKDYDALAAVASEMAMFLRERHTLNCLELQQEEPEICICEAREQGPILQKYKQLAGGKNG